MTSPRTSETVVTFEEGDLTSRSPSTVKTAEGVYLLVDKAFASLIRIVVTGLLTLLFFVVVARIMWAAPESWEQTKEASQIILPVVTGVYGTALGFYFGSKREDEE